ncbi:MAG: flagellar motor switch protein FliG, partial [Gammaproteobacteria bacterium]|nr:flagellar motor switch protein FliG [Gammaproteobacteria bacterium]
MSEPEQGKDLTPAGATDEDANNALVQSETGLSGTERAAVLLLTLGEEEAASVMKHMDHKEVQRIGMGMANLSNVTKIQVTQVVKEFYEIMQNATALGVDTDDYIRNVLVKALGEEKANNLLDRIL